MVNPSACVDNETFGSDCSILVGLPVLPQVAIDIERLLDGRVANALLDQLRATARFDPKTGGGVA